MYNKDTTKPNSQSYKQTRQRVQSDRLCVYRGGEENDGYKRCGAVVWRQTGVCIQ